MVRSIWFNSDFLLYKFKNYFCKHSSSPLGLEHKKQRSLNEINSNVHTLYCLGWNFYLAYKTSLLDTWENQIPTVMFAGTPLWATYEEFLTDNRTPLPLAKLAPHCNLWDRNLKPEINNSFMGRHQFWSWGPFREHRRSITSHHIRQSNTNLKMHSILSDIANKNQLPE